MKQQSRYTETQTFFDQYHHYILAGLCLLFIAVSFVITGCDLTFGNDDEPEPPPTATSDEIVALPFFLENSSGIRLDKVSEMKSDMKLYDDIKGKPVMAPDSHQVTWSEWSNVEGSIFVECTEYGTRIKLDLQGLIPKGVYTIWNVIFEEPGFTGEFETPGLPANVDGIGPGGPSDGSRSKFIASAGGEASTILTTLPGPLGTVGEIGKCALTDELEWHVVGLYHFDGKTYGSVRGPEGTRAEQFAFIFKKES